MATSSPTLLTLSIVRRAVSYVLLALVIELLLLIEILENTEYFFFQTPTF